MTGGPPAIPKATTGTTLHGCTWSTTRSAWVPARCRRAIARSSSGAPGSSGCPPRPGGRAARTARVPPPAVAARRLDEPRIDLPVMGEEQHVVTAAIGIETHPPADERGVAADRVGAVHHVKPPHRARPWRKAWRRNGKLRGHPEQAALEARRGELPEAVVGGRVR